ncbi:MAG: ABC transporter substrate-binding protein [Oscillospiraceae bacterium]|nr:ABC transporter substrate-binding protein [Oscillospiraceae bacterium]
MIRKHSKAFAFIAIILMMAMLVTACTPAAPGPAEEPPTQQQPAETPGDENGESPADGRGGGEVIFVQMSEAPFLDPIRQNDSATSDITTQMMEGLMMFTVEGDLVPLLAESYRPMTPVDAGMDLEALTAAFEASVEQENESLLATVDEDDEDAPQPTLREMPTDARLEEFVDSILIWEFDLRQDVYFHDGALFTAEAVKMSLDRILNPQEAAPGRFILDMIRETEVVDDHTVRLHLYFPFTPILAHLTHQAAFIQSPLTLAEELAGGTTINENPIGTGPFVFEYLVSGDYTRLSANMNYWNGAPDIDYLIFRVIPETATRLAMLDTGEAHATLALTGDTPTIEMMGDHVDWWAIPSTTINYIGINCSTGHPALQDALVRQAISMAVNRQDILDAAAEGNGILAVGPVGPNVLHSATDTTPLPFDPDAAQALLEEAGWGDGFSLNIWFNYGNAGRAMMAEIVQFNLAQIGIDVSIEALEWGAYLERTAAGEHDMFILGWVTMTGDADYGMYSLFHSSTHGNAGNRTFYTNERVDALLDEGRSESNPARRDAIYRELTEILIEEAPWIFLFHPIQPVVTNGITGLGVDFNFTPFFHNVRLLD